MKNSNTIRIRAASLAVLGLITAGTLSACGSGSNAGDGSYFNTQQGAKLVINNSRASVYQYNCGRKKFYSDGSGAVSASGKKIIWDNNTGYATVTKLGGGGISLSGDIDSPGTYLPTNAQKDLKQYCSSQ